MANIENAFNLGKPIAGNFFQIGYDGQSTNDQLCHVSKCLGSPFPSLITGVNDMPECMPESVWHGAGLVPSKLSEIPPTNLKVKFDSGLKITNPGQEMPTGQVGSST